MNIIESSFCVFSKSSYFYIFLWKSNFSKGYYLSGHLNQKSIVRIDNFLRLSKLVIKISPLLVSKNRDAKFSILEFIKEVFSLYTIYVYIFCRLFLLGQCSKITWPLLTCKQILSVVWKHNYFLIKYYC